MRECEYRPCAVTEQLVELYYDNVASLIAQGAPAVDMSGEHPDFYRLDSPDESTSPLSYMVSKDEGIVDMSSGSASIKPTPKIESMAGMIRAYFDTLAFQFRVIDEAEARLNHHTGLSFNTIGLFTPDENALSDVFAALLDPNGAHGQRDAFLSAFLDVLDFDIPPKDRALCRVTREESTANIENTMRRVDIVLHLGRYAVGIENKPWTWEQDRQLQAYHDHLHANYGNNTYLVFMPGDGRRPETLEDPTLNRLMESRRVSILSYRPALAGDGFTDPNCAIPFFQLTDWLERCVKACEAPKVRYFIQDLLAYVQTTFPSDSSFLQEDDDLIAQEQDEDQS